MGLFGWTIARESDLDSLFADARRVTAMSEMMRWMSGWRDLNIIWRHIIDEGRSSIINTREEYAAARGTTVYGEPLPPAKLSDISGSIDMAFASLKESPDAK